MSNLRPLSNIEIGIFEAFKAEFEHDPDSILLLSANRKDGTPVALICVHQYMPETKNYLIQPIAELITGSIDDLYINPTLEP